MSTNSANVRVAVTGAIRVGTAAAQAPVDADAPLGAGWADLGYVSEDGVTETRDRSTNSIKGWQNGDIVREVVTEAKLSYKVVLIETKRETVELYYAGKVDARGGIVIVPARTGGRKPYVLDVIDDDEFIRTYIAEGEITEVGEQVYASGEPIGYEATITAYPSPAIVDPETGEQGAAIKWYASLADYVSEEA